MKRKVLKVLALTGFLTFGLVGASCGEDTPVVTDETTSDVVNVVLSGAKDLKVGETLTLTPHFDDGGKHDVCLIAVVAEHDGKFAQTTAAYRTGHGGISQYGGAGYGAAVDQGRQSFRDENLEDDLRGGCAHP